MVGMADASDGDFSEYEEVWFQAEAYGHPNTSASHFLDHDVLSALCGRYIVMKKECSETEDNCYLQIIEVQVLSTIN